MLFTSSDHLGNIQNLPFKRQTNRVLKHTQTIRRFYSHTSMFDCFVGLALKRLCPLHFGSFIFKSKREPLSD